ncbi:psbP domain-containing protein 1, chloroplastic isoform X3 [Phragmites australis]|uniref:psbP domain-containing protein 1, chloroplastic isoform X3 n=1 Tax=Phragmites australis TaxID=29695 RepID=UPI002D77A2D6|nr:psbP domain-containing protein 1, chloroplastic isoform X3 [Phragmites australis]
MHLVPRRNVLSMMISTSTVLLFGPKQITLAETTGGAFREYIDTFDGYTFLYPKSWIQVRGAGADIFFRDPFVLDENLSVEISSPSSSKYETVEDLGPPEKAAEKVLKQYLTEFMSTRLGVRRESNVLSASSNVADDGRLYYEVEVTRIGEHKILRKQQRACSDASGQGAEAGVGPAIPVGPRRREQATLRATVADAGTGVHGGRGGPEKSHGLLQGHQDGVVRCKCGDSSCSNALWGVEHKIFV